MISFPTAAVIEEFGKKVVGSTLPLHLILIAVPKNETAADLANAIYEFSDGIAGQFDHQDVVPGSREIIEYET